MQTIKNSATRSLVAVFALAALFSTGCKPSGPKSLLEGERLIQAGKPEEAIASLLTATKLLPQNAQAWNHLGIAYHDSGQITDALEAYQKAAAINPNLAAVRFNIGCLQLESGRAKAAVNEFATFNVLQTNSYEGLLWLGTAQLHAQQLADAEKSLTRAAQIRPRSPEAHNTLGVLHIQQKRVPDAVKNFSAVLLHTNYPPTLLNAAIALHHHYPGRAADNRKEALLRYRKYLETEPRSPHANAVQSLVRQLESEFETPKITATNAPPKVAVTNTSPAATNRIVTVTNTAPPTNIVIVTPKATSTPPVKPKPPIETNVVIVTPPFPKPPAVIEPPKLTTNRPPVTVTNVASIPPVKPNPPLPVGPRYKYKKPTAPAEGQRAEANAPFEKALTHHRLGQLPEAIAGYRMAVKADPAYFQAQLNLALALHGANDLANALVTYETALAIDPLSLLARYNFSLALDKQKFPIDSASELEELLGTHPAYVPAHLQAANLYAQQLKQPDRAREHYRRVLQLEPGHTEATNIRRWLAAHPE